MKFYRSIEFSKLVFMLQEERQFLWDEYQDKRDKEDSELLHRNWWMNDSFEKERREIISAVINESNGEFFAKSMQFNAMSGGRFNPERSFGLLYCANDPLTSALEVLYHKFIDLYPLYANIQAKKSQITSGLDMKIPDELKVFIIAFEIKINDQSNLYKLNENEQNLKSICDKIGFQRYTTKNFDREFIFGNDYEISRHVGTYLHGLGKDGFLVPSARVDFDTQDELDLKNAIFYEGRMDHFNPALTGNFVEYRCSIDLKKIDSDGLNVVVEVFANKNKKTTFKLQNMPPRKGDHPQIKSYQPNINISNSRPRVVHIQKYFVPKPKKDVES